MRAVLVFFHTAVRKKTRRWLTAGWISADGQNVTFDTSEHRFWFTSCLNVCVCVRTCERLSGKRLQLHFNVQQMCRVKREQPVGGSSSTEISRSVTHSSAPPNGLTLNHPATIRLSNAPGNTRSSSSHTCCALFRLKPAEHSSLALLVFTDRPACCWSINAAEVRGRLSEAILNFYSWSGSLASTLVCVCVCVCGLQLCSATHRG